MTSPRDPAAAPFVRVPTDPTAALRGQGLARALCWVGIVIGNLWRVAEIWLHNPVSELWSDSGRNWEFGGLATQTHPLVLVDPIGYQTFLGLVEKITLGIPLLVFAVVAGMSISAPWVWYRFLRELLSSKTLALLGWAILALLPSWIGIYSYFMMETLFIPLFGWALWMTWRCHRKSDTRSFVVMALCWLLAGLTRSVAGPLAAVVVLALWSRQSEKLTKAVVVGSVVVASLAFLGYRSYVRTGIFGPLGNPYLNQAYVWSGRQEILIDYFSSTGENYHYGFGSPVTNERPLTPLSAWKNDRVGSFIAKIDLASQQLDWRQTVDLAKAQGWPWAKIAKENMIYLFFGRSWPDCSPERFTEMATQPMRWIWAPLALFGLGALLRRFHELRWDAGLLLLLIITWIVVQGLIPLAVNEGRYRKPMEGVFIAAALLAFDRRRRDQPSQARHTQVEQDYMRSEGDMISPS